MLVFPQKNYIFKAIRHVQPASIKKRLRKVHDLNFEFLPIADNVVSLELNDILRDLFVKNDKYLYPTLAQFLYKINLIFGKVNDYVFRGTVSRRVLELFLKSVWDSELSKR